MCRRFGKTLFVPFHRSFPTRPTKMEQSVPKRPHIKFRPPRESLKRITTFTALQKFEIKDFLNFLTSEHQEGKTVAMLYTVMRSFCEMYRSAIKGDSLHVTTATRHFYSSQWNLSISKNVCFRLQSLY